MPREKRNRARKAVTSEEDRPLYLQQRAQAEAELARKKEEILTHFLRDKLQDDEKNSALNLLKLNDGWRSILRQKKSTEIHKDLDVLQQNFERQVDLLDSIIKNLEVNVSEAESQSAQLHRSHLQKIQTLLELQRKRMDYLEQGWESAMETIQDQYTTQRKRITAEIQQQHQDIDDNSLLIQHNYDEMMNEIAAVYRQAMDFYENLFLDKVSKLEKIPEERRREHQQLMQQHSARCQELETLIKENQESTESIERSSREIQRLQKKLLDLQTSLRTGDNGLSEVEHQLSVTTEGIQTLRAQMEQERSKSRKRLTVLSVSNDKAAKKLLNVVNTGERVLRLAKLCKKLEDKLLITEEMNTPPENELAEEGEDQESWEYPQLNLFNARQNSALLQREVLRRRRDAMRRENTQLQLKIQQLQGNRETLTISGQTIPRADNKKVHLNASGQDKTSPNPPPGCALSLTGTQVPIAAGQKRMQH
ncbi:dynein regulatory complex subunit 2 [Boleophthalmus pectinirostris]|uniref:dynein regulatory complex subunit 2 n=1 Tax=Boleophthalmus pectinirostris TaxID=150288 RepID=UPI000A1C5986|nr:dynein regulatory complex subunit 2 [Boleophthalmus pectinirostris]